MELKHFINQYCIAALRVFSLTGCEKFLDERPRTEITEATFYRTAADFNLAARGLYNTLQNHFFSGVLLGHDGAGIR